MVNPSQDIQYKFLIMLHVGSMNFQQIIESARNIIALRHFGNVADDTGIVIYSLKG